MEAGSDNEAIFDYLAGLGCETHTTSSVVLSVAARGSATLCTIDGLSVDVNILLANSTDDSHMRAVWDALELSGVTTINPLAAVRAANDKRRVAARLRNGSVPVPDWVSLAPGDMRRGSAALLALGCPVAVILPRAKPGGGVTLAWDPNGLFALLETHGAEHGLMLQRYIQDGAREIRVCVIGGEARSAVLRSTNIPVELTANERAIAEAAQRALGLEVTAVDLVLDNGSVVVLDVTPNAPLVFDSAASGTDLIQLVAQRLLTRALRTASM